MKRKVIASLDIQRSRNKRSELKKERIIIVIIIIMDIANNHSVTERNHVDMNGVK